MTKRSRARMSGYCSLCRAKEIELYGTVLSKAGPRHNRACREAGCRHPYSYPAFLFDKPNPAPAQQPAA